MGSIFARKGTRKLYAKLQAVDYTWKQVPTGCDDTPEGRVAAEAWLADMERKVAAERAAQAAGVSSSSAASTSSSASHSVRAYALGPWIEERRKLDLDWKNDEGRLKHHVLPVIGDMLLRDVRTRHIVDLFRYIRTRADRRVAQRTVYNIYSVVSALFRDAKLADLIEQSPCCLDERQLGPLRDKDPEWRADAVFARDEVETIISTPAIPDDRRIVYALELLAGVRPGEAAALRWRHYDPMVKPLGKLLVAFGYNTRKNRVKGTKTEVVKHVPVHATLAAMLAEWKLSGWAAMMGRAPEPDDLIVPLPPRAAARRRSRDGEPFRGHDYSGKRWREEDLPALRELEPNRRRHRRHYDMRATFITLALEDGADPHVIETRVTHTKRSRSAFDGYNRGMQWEITCREVAKLNVRRRANDLVSAIVPIAAVGSRAVADAENPSRSTFNADGLGHVDVVDRARGHLQSADGQMPAVGAPCGGAHRMNDADMVNEGVHSGLGAVVVQSSESPTIAADTWWRRRESKYRERVEIHFGRRRLADLSRSSASPFSR